MTGDVMGDLDDVVIEARRNLHDGNYVDPRPLLDMIERLAPQPGAPREDERLREALRAIRDYVFASVTIPALDRHRLLTFTDGTLRTLVEP